MYHPPNLYVVSPVLNMMVFGGRGFGTWLGHEGAALMNGISALMQMRPQRASLLSLHDVRTQEKMAICSLEEAPQDPTMLAA